MLTIISALYLFKDTFSKYTYKQISDEMDRDYWGTVTQVDKVVYLGFGYCIKKIMRFEHIFKYVFKYLMVDMYSYPNSDFYDD